MAQHSGIKAFFSKNPADIGLVGHLYNYILPTDNILIKEGKNYAGLAQIGQRITIKTKRNSSIYIRQGFEYGIDNSKGYSIMAPLTFNISLGAGSHSKCNDIYGFVVGGGYAYHKVAYNKTKDNTLFAVTNTYYSPFIQIGITQNPNIKKLVHGLYFSAGRNSKYYTLSLSYIINLLY